MDDDPKGKYPNAGESETNSNELLARYRRCKSDCCARVNFMVKLLRAHGGCLGRNRR